MSKNLIGKAAVGAALISLQIVPVSSLKKESVMVLQVQAATISSTYTDEQKVTYTIDQKAGNATASAYSGLSGAAIVIPESISFEGQSYPVVAIGASAFLNSGISSVIIGNNVTDIGTSAFQTTTAYPDFYKASLKSVMLGQNVQSIKTDAFAGNALTNIQFPDSLSKIGSRAFANNFLTTVSFGSNLLDIASKAFQTNNISAIIFANNCATTVESAAFSGSPVEKIIFGAEVTWASDVLNKMSPLYGQLSDLPENGVRIVSESQGVLQKSWLEELPNDAKTGDNLELSASDSNPSSLTASIASEDSQTSEASSVSVPSDLVSPDSSADSLTSSMASEDSQTSEASSVSVPSDSVSPDSSADSSLTPVSTDSEVAVLSKTSMEPDSLFSQTNNPLISLEIPDVVLPILLSSNSENEGEIIFPKSADMKSTNLLKEKNMRGSALVSRNKQVMKNISIDLTNLSNEKGVKNNVFSDQTQFRNFQTHLTKLSKEGPSLKVSFNKEFQGVVKSNESNDQRAPVSLSASISATKKAKEQLIKKIRKIISESSKENAKFSNKNAKPIHPKASQFPPIPLLITVLLAVFSLGHLLLKRRNIKNDSR